MIGVDTSTALVRLTDLDDADASVECTIDEFVEANAETLSAAELANLAKLDVGQALRFGGGACPGMEVRRVS